jgi:two-component system, LuxR family, response regulator FixJ
MIFLVENDEATRDAIHLLLECEGLAAAAFTSCEALCAALDPASADLLILDMQIIDGSGFELLERLRNRGTAPPVILMMGDPTAKVYDHAAVAGAFGILEKPFRGSDLVSLIDRALAGRDAK